MLEINAAEQEKYRKSLSLEKKAHMLKSMLPNKKNTANLSHPRKKPMC
jgi:hypothetical protein